jgi:cytochrome c oxidase subunit II
MWDFLLWPESASTVAADVDQLTLTLTALSFFFAFPIAALIVYFAIKYRRGSPADRSGAIVTSHALETTWIAVPLVLALGLFGWGARLFVHMYEIPPDGLDVYVVGKQWMWQFEHPTGQREINELHVPVNQPVRLTMISQDVIHSFYVPAFRVKLDVLPGRYTVLWFEATQTGSFHLFCAEYCGTQHSGMVGRVVVMEPRLYQEWLTQRPLDLAQPIPQHSAVQPEAGLPLASAGQQLFQNLGCSTCHLVDERGTGPPLVGLYGSEVLLASGETVIADAQYIRRSIIDPNAQIVAGYPPIMPTYAGQITEEEILRLVEYIRSLGADEQRQEEPPSDGG